MEVLKELIEKRTENDIVDFKLQFYSADKKYDLIKDILSFANSCTSADKYLIFGYDNKADTYNDITDSDIEDISNYNQLISEYCDPFIDIQLDRFELNGHKLASIQIKRSNNNGPYLVKKECKKGDKTFFRKGEIYIRKNANNFVAERDDIDAIYENRKRILLEIDGAETGRVFVKHGSEVAPMYCLMLKFINNTSSTISFNIGKIKFKYEKNCFETSIEYIDEYAKNYKKELLPIRTHPFVIDKETQALKSLVFELSDEVTEIIKSKFVINEKPMITIILVDLQGKEYKTSFALNVAHWG